MPNPDGRADFDFLVGAWLVHHRRLRERLHSCSDWEEFDGTLHVRKVLGGLGNVDEITLNREGQRAEGLTLRLFNPSSRQWSLYWVDTVSATLQIPLVGSFKDGKGEFFADETFEGRPIVCRFIWSEIAAQTCRWEQAFSEDRGDTWETNWIMEFSR